MEQTAEWCGEDAGETIDIQVRTEVPTVRVPWPGGRWKSALAAGRMSIVDVRNVRDADLQMVFRSSEDDDGTLIRATTVGLWSNHLQV